MYCKASTGDVCWPKVATSNLFKQQTPLRKQVNKQTNDQWINSIVKGNNTNNE